MSFANIRVEKARLWFIIFIDSLDTVNLATEPIGDSGGASPHNQDYLFY